MRVLVTFLLLSGFALCARAADPDELAIDGSETPGSATLYLFARGGYDTPVPFTISIDKDRKTSLPAATYARLPLKSGVHSFEAVRGLKPRQNFLKFKIKTAMDKTYYFALEVVPRGLRSGAVLRQLNAYEASTFISAMKEQPVSDSK